MICRVMVVKYGFADLEVESESQALDMVADMDDRDFQQSELGDEQIVDVLDE